MTTKNIHESYDGLLRERNALLEALGNILTAPVVKELPTKGMVRADIFASDWKAAKDLMKAIEP